MFAGSVKIDGKRTAKDIYDALSFEQKEHLVKLDIGFEYSRLTTEGCLIAQSLVDEGLIDRRENVNPPLKINTAGKMVAKYIHEQNINNKGKR